MSAFSTPWQAALTGAILAFTAALVYALGFSLLASLRASLRIRRIVSPGAGTAMLYLANNTSILVASMEFGLILGLVASLIQGLAWLLIAALSTVLVVSPLAIALVIALLVTAGLHLVLWNTKDITHAILWRAFTSSGYWLGLPCLIFITMTLLAFA